MRDNKSLIVYKENIFNKIKKFFINLFSSKNKEENIIVNLPEKENYIGSSKKKFNEYISFRENKEELNIINDVRKNPDMLNRMSMEELDKIEEAILNRTKFVDRKISKLRTDLMMKKMEFKSSNGEVEIYGRK